MNLAPSGATRLESVPRRKAGFIEPMDCAPVPNLPDGSNWVFEIKLDGYRAVAVKSDRGVNLFSRRRKSFDHHYPLIVEALGELPEGTVVGGEVVALDESGARILAFFSGSAANFAHPGNPSSLSTREFPKLRQRVNITATSGNLSTNLVSRRAYDANSTGSGSFPNLGVLPAPKGDMS